MTQVFRILTFSIHRFCRGFAPLVPGLWAFGASLFVGSALHANDYASSRPGASNYRSTSAYTPQGFHNTRKTNYGLKENTEVRIRLQRLFSAPVDQVLTAPQTIYSQRDGNLPVMFQVRLNNSQPDKLYYAFVNRSYDEGASIIYPVSSRGSYLIRRDLKQDRIDQIKIFLAQSLGGKQSFIRISPQKPATQQSNTSANSSPGIAQEKSVSPGGVIEVVLFGRTVYSGVPVSVPFHDILTMPLWQFLKVSAQAIQWDNLLSDPTLTEWQLVQNVPDQLRPYLYQIPEVYDGAMDARGLFVRIETGEPLAKPGMNCSGFIKWVADGIYRSHKNWSEEQLYLDIDKLKKRQVELRGAANPWNNAAETSRDPYFGLDWARAIARELLELEVQHTTDPRATDVQKIPFFKYFDNVGYPVTDIHAMMYLLAVQDPGSFYLGAINGTFGDPELHQYYHEVVFFPYFQGDGSFQLIVMDTGAERSDGYIEARYEGNYVHLSRIRASYKYKVAPLGRPTVLVQ